MRDTLGAHYTREARQPDESQLEDFRAAGIESVEDIKRGWVDSFFFGSESDDRTVAHAFNDRANPLGVKMDLRWLDDASWDLVYDAVFDAAASRDQTGWYAEFRIPYSQMRMTDGYQGTWGLIRLLEQARVTTLDDGDSHYRLVLKAPDGLGLTWHLRTELGAGPLALLKLRGFKLPTQIFLGVGNNAEPFAQNGEVP